MRTPGIVLTCVVGGLAVGLLFTWLTWNYVFSNIDRGMVKMMWGTFNGHGSFGGQ